MFLFLMNPYIILFYFESIVHRHIFVKLNTFCKNHILFRNVLTARTYVSIANKNMFSLEILVFDHLHGNECFVFELSYKIFLPNAFANISVHFLEYCLAEAPSGNYTLR